MLLKLKFIDGSPVPETYVQQLQPLLNDCTHALELFSEDELEEAVRNYRKQEAAVKAGVS